MSAPTPDSSEYEQFRKMMNEEFPVTPTEYADPTPYGTAYGIPATHAKPGLTKRGKVAIGIGTAVIATGGLIGYQHYSAITSANEAKAQEIALQTQQLKLEELKELNRASEASQKAESTADKARQTSIDKCVNSKEKLVGKGFGTPTYQDVIDACQTQYTTPTSTDDMQAASATEPTGTATGGGINDGLLIGGGVLGLIALIAARRGTRSNPA